MDFSHLYLSTEGRIGRQSFWIGHLILAAIGIVFLMIIAAIFGQLSFATRVMNFLYALIIAYPAYAVSAKRFQDRNKNGALGAILIGLTLLSSLLSLIGLTGDPVTPNALGMMLGIATLVVAVWFLVELGILRGTVGDNQYGPAPIG